MPPPRLTLLSSLTWPGEGRAGRHPSWSCQPASPSQGLQGSGKGTGGVGKAVLTQQFPPAQPLLSFLHAQRELLEGEAGEKAKGQREEKSGNGHDMPGSQSARERGSAWGNGSGPDKWGVEGAQWGLLPGLSPPGPRAPLGSSFPGHQAGARPSCSLPHITPQTPGRKRPWERN